MTLSSRTRRQLAAWGAATLALPGGLARAADWPTRQVSFLQPYAPGTALDAVTRFLAERCAKQWRQPVVVENRAGANGVIGTEVVARAPGDGHTLLFTATGHFTNELLMPRLPFDPARDFKPVAKLASVALVLIVPRRAPFSTVGELVEYARRNPGKLSYASAGSGSSQHLSAAAFVAQTRIDVLHVPYKTQTQALNDTLGGHVDFSFAAVATAAAQLKGGNLRALGTTGSQRSIGLPDLPTLAESGIAGYEFAGFNAVYAPAATPDPIVQAAADAFEAGVRSPAFAELARTQGIDIDFQGPRAWAAAQAGERRRWAELIRASGAKLE